MDQNQAPQQMSTTPLPQGHPAGYESPSLPIPIQPTNQQPQPNQPAVPMMPPPPPPRKGGGMKMIIITLVIILILSVIAGVVLFVITSGGGTKKEIITDPKTKDEVGPREHEAQEFPEFQGVEIGEKTVAFNKVDESFQIRHLGKIYHEQDTGEFAPREFVPVEEASKFDWYGLVNPPESAINDGALTSFKAPLTYQSFMFIMRWDDIEGERYYMYRFHDNKVTLLREFTKERLFYYPVIDSFSLGGNFASIKLFTCSTCVDETPEVLLYEISTGHVKNLGQVSHFAWGNDDKSYEYKEYREGVDPVSLPLRKNEFFSDSVNILDP